MNQSLLRPNMAVHSLSGSVKRLRAADLAAIRRAHFVVLLAVFAFNLATFGVSLPASLD
jgi:hypothetical protein